MTMPGQKPSIVESWQKLIQDRERQRANSLSKLTKANDLYNDLIAKGFHVRKGNRLRGLEDFHLLNMRPNQ
jgi:hypothetical protein